MKSNNVKTPCPITKVARLLSDTWTMLIMHAFLDSGEKTNRKIVEKRFCELERELPGISTRTLTNKLNTLVSEGLLSKTKDGAYRATPRGQGLAIIESAMRTYEKKYLSN